MLDIRFIRENPDRVQTAAAQKGYTVNIQELLHADESRRELQQKADELRTRRNEIAAQMKGGKPAAELVEEGKRIKTELAGIEDHLRVVSEAYQDLLWAVPNITLDDVPLGCEEDSVEIKKVGEQKTGAKDHLDFALARDWVDFERGTKVAGAKFYFVKGDLALLENAIVQFALQKVTEKGFTLMTVPHMVNQRTMTGTGFAPRTSDQSDEYSIEGEDLSLIATAEISLTGYHADEVIDEARLPLLYAGYSPCYRKEAGAAGKHTRGLFRVHQFNKLEMYAYTTPEQSAEVHEKILAIEEELWQEMGIPYHVINIAAGDLGAPAAKKYDIEYWSPVDGKYRELTSCSNCTDFQARNLNIRVRRPDGSIEVLHTLNGTAVSLARSLVAVLENYQNEDGTLRVPEVLRPYLGGREVL
ncbi:seryl-tRNA synthetase [Candidatus Saccharimonas aalborgensis]|uniref:Serine--tRNA ligase n=1 Tax=Candidatus Saccharimonas aalborgensis TaxID=1332188 RepID=R4PXG9_9BACT|nr:serine--tRNA ligase [Candidatus Saccharimonas aalborgensis]MBP7775486.1 serine--tRNA ligase [Candidatus Saccharimonas sp.]QQR51214.1 MAG: serine--tRNA ligase [Candidatus Saccharibacteria bacterium]AGL62462.1 seryl-tRNA synthetase [Candidatus Saccharimonas aalborgensis]QQS67964.1 MAG: serine--tRNA ligase [Candidatus Saccharibacteria bacterium]QQS70305.1 MAG: serine--tRNA ligase [Candidatus Saccharibacteria bacterium]